MKKLVIISLIVILTIFWKNIESHIYPNFYHTYQSDDIIEFDLNGDMREYLLHIPKNIQPNAPLVFVLHGLGETSTRIRKYSGMNDVADKYCFVVCYPQGSPSTERTIYTTKGTYFWNVGYEIHKNETVDDIYFLKSLANYLQKKYNLNSDRTFCAGMSNGGDMNYLLGCEASDVFKAIAPIAGTMMEWVYKSCNRNNSISVLHLHGTRDMNNRFHGDIDNKDKWGAYISVEKSVKFWVDKNKCMKTGIDTLPDLNEEDGSFIIRERYEECNNDNEVWFYRVVEGGHEWPTKRWRWEYWGNRDVNTSEEIWKFFSRI